MRGSGAIFVAIAATAGLVHADTCVNVGGVPHDLCSYIKSLQDDQDSGEVVSNAIDDLFDDDGVRALLKNAISTSVGNSDLASAFNQVVSTAPVYSPIMKSVADHALSLAVAGSLLDSVTSVGPNPASPTGGPAGISVVVSVLPTSTAGPNGVSSSSTSMATSNTVVNLNGHNSTLGSGAGVAGTGEAAISGAVSGAVLAAVMVVVAWL